MSHQSFSKVWRSLRVERFHLAQLLLQALKNKEPELYRHAKKLNEEDEFEMKELPNEDLRECNEEVVDVARLEHLELLEELSEIEKIRKFSDSSIDDNKE